MRAIKNLLQELFSICIKHDVVDREGLCEAEVLASNAAASTSGRSAVYLSGPLINVGLIRDVATSL